MFAWDECLIFLIIHMKYTSSGLAINIKFYILCIQTVIMFYVKYFLKFYFTTFSFGNWNSGKKLLDERAFTHFIK